MMKVVRSDKDVFIAVGAAAGVPTLDVKRRIIV